ncbi:MAG: hypothetical protein ABIW47_03000 [Ginsengibacter sp.]
MIRLFSILLSLPEEVWVVKIIPGKKLRIFAGTKYKKCELQLMEWAA